MPIEWDLNRRVVIRNLGPAASKSEIQTLFQNFGRVNKLWVARNPPGFAFLEFSSRRDAKEAVRSLDGKRCCGSTIRVELTAEYSERPRNYLAIKHPQNAFISSTTRQRRKFQRHRTRTSDYNNSGNNDPLATSGSIVINIFGGGERVGGDGGDESQRAQASHGLVNDIMSTISERYFRQQHNQSSVRGIAGVNFNADETVSNPTTNCPVCMDNVKDKHPTVTNCGHVFCAECITQVVHRTRKCPVCNKKNNENTLIRVYL